MINDYKEEFDNIFSINKTNYQIKGNLKEPPEEEYPIIYEDIPQEIEKNWIQDLQNGYNPIEQMKTMFSKNRPKLNEDLLLAALKYIELSTPTGQNSLSSDVAKLLEFILLGPPEYCDFLSANNIFDILQPYLPQVLRPYIYILSNSISSCYKFVCSNVFYYVCDLGLRNQSLMSEVSEIFFLISRSPDVVNKGLDFFNIIPFPKEADVFSLCLNEQVSSPIFDFYDIYICDLFSRFLTPENWPPDHSTPFFALEALKNLFQNVEACTAFAPLLFQRFEILFSTEDLSVSASKAFLQCAKHVSNIFTNEFFAFLPMLTSSDNMKMQKDLMRFAAGLCDICEWNQLQEQGIIQAIINGSKIGSFDTKKEALNAITNIILRTEEDYTFYIGNSIFDTLRNAKIWTVLDDFIEIGLSFSDVPFLKKMINVARILMKNELYPDLNEGEGNTFFETLNDISTDLDLAQQFIDENDKNQFYLSVSALLGHFASLLQEKKKEVKEEIKEEENFKDFDTQFGHILASLH